MVVISKAGEKTKAYRNNGKFSKGYEVKGSKRYIMVPPSWWITQSGRVYTETEFKERYYLEGEIETCP